MYLEYFGFQSEPFNITPDTRFLFLSRRHKEALAALRYGIDQRKGFIALTGDVGCGKTTICRALLNSLDREKTRIALVLNPQVSDLELLQLINAEFGIPSASSSKRELLDALNKFLLDEFARGHNCALLIDESQRLSFEALEQVRLISNLETETTKLIQIALVGQPELGEILDMPELEQLNQRITVRCHIEPLDAEEIAEYVAHRMEVAQPKTVPVFQKKAIRRIYEHSRGVPRRVNVLCDRVLLVTFVREETEVSEDIVAQAIKEVSGKERPRQRKAVPKNARPPVQRPAEEDLDPIGENDAVEAVTEAPAGASSDKGPMVLLTVIGVIIVAAVLFWQMQEYGSTGTSGAQIAAQPTPRAVRTPRAIVATATPTAVPTPTPVPTPEVGVLVTPSYTPTPAPSPTPFPTPAPTATPVLILPTPQPTPAPTPMPSPTPEMAPRWSYDAAGIMRHDERAASYPACVLTWLARTDGTRLPDAELQRLRTTDSAEVARMQLASGAPPLFLREARLAASLDTVRPGWLPVLVQVGNDAPFGPWAVLVDLTPSLATIFDPGRGQMVVARAQLEDHVTAVVALYRDMDSLTGLKPKDEGERVRMLQTRLRAAGVLGEATRDLFDEATANAVQAARVAWQIPGTAEIDPPFALRLVRGEGTKP